MDVLRLQVAGARAQSRDLDARVGLHNRIRIVSWPRRRPDRTAWTNRESIQLQEATTPGSGERCQPDDREATSQSRASPPWESLYSGGFAPRNLLGTACCRSSQSGETESSQLRMAKRSPKNYVRLSKATQCRSELEDYQSLLMAKSKCHSVVQRRMALTV